MKIPDPPAPMPNGSRSGPAAGWRPLTTLASRALGRLMGNDHVDAIDVFGRQPTMFWAWTTFWIPLMLRGGLTRTDSELVILRSTWNAGCSYEWQHHVDASRLGGISSESVQRVAEGPQAEGWSPKYRALLTAVDELCADRMITDETWTTLRDFYDDRQLTTVCFLVGNYAMLAMALNSSGVREQEVGAWERGRSLLPISRSHGGREASASVLPAWLPRVNKAVTNRIQGPLAPCLPPYAVVVHRGRKSGNEYRTPVTAFVAGSTVAVALPYGPDVDWVRNVLAFGGGEVVRAGRRYRLDNPRVVDATQADDLPAPARVAARFVGVLVADLTNRG
ncbi:MAG: nitroreductase family deazaflavin-dependent oxidoreductase [Acidimicrobiales bacterium]